MSTKVEKLLEATVMRNEVGVTNGSLYRTFTPELSDEERKDLAERALGGLMSYFAVNEDEFLATTYGRMAFSMFVIGVSMGTTMRDMSMAGTLTDDPDDA